MRAAPCLPLLACPARRQPTSRPRMEYAADAIPRLPCGCSAPRGPDGAVSYAEDVARAPLSGRGPPDPPGAAYGEGRPQDWAVLASSGLMGKSLAQQPATAHAREPLETLCDELLAGLAPHSTDDIALLALRLPERPGIRTASPRGAERPSPSAGCSRASDRGLHDGPAQHGALRPIRASNKPYHRAPCGFTRQVWARRPSEA